MIFGLLLFIVIPVMAGALLWMHVDPFLGAAVGVASFMGLTWMAVYLW